MRVIWHYAVAMLIVLLTLEGSAFLASIVLKHAGLMIGDLDPEGYEAYLRERHPVTGWPAPSAFGRGEFEVSGVRISPAFPDIDQPPCVSLFGDSFTWGDEVGPEHAYGNVLARLLGCRVANYGVGGFGTDQSFLRFLDRSDDRAPVVVLGHYSENIIRNVNQLRDLMAGGRFGFKPRFVLEGTNKALRHVPLPSISQAEYARLPDSAEALLPFEYFLPGSNYGLEPVRFPFSLSVGRALLHYRIQARLEGVPSYAEFYDDDHPSEALGVTVRILESFVREAAARGQKGIVLIIPDGKDLELKQAGGDLPYEPLRRALGEHGVPTIPLAEGLLERLDGRAPCSLYTACNPTSGHFNERGYALVAEIVADSLQRQRLDHVPQ